MCVTVEGGHIVEMYRVVWRFDAHFSGIRRDQPVDPHKLRPEFRSFARAAQIKERTAQHRDHVMPSPTARPTDERRRDLSPRGYLPATGSAPLRLARSPHTTPNGQRRHPQQLQQTTCGQDPRLPRRARRPRGSRRRPTLRPGARSVRDCRR